MYYLKRKLYEFLYSEKDKEIQRLQESNARLLEELDQIKKEETLIPFYRIDHVNERGVPPHFIPEDGNERMIILSELSGLYRSETVRNMLAYIINYAANKAARGGNTKFTYFIHGVDAIWKVIKFGHSRYTTEKSANYVEYNEFNPIQDEDIEDLLDNI